jgi:hypothetical protein
MADAINRGDKNIGLKKTSAWGTGTEPDTECRVPIADFTPPTGERDFYTNEGESGNENMADCIEALNYMQQSISMSFKARFDAPHLVKTFFTVYGKADFDADTPEAGVNKHSFEWDPIIDSIDDMLHSIAYDEKSEVKAVPSAIITGFDMSYDKGFNVAIDMIGDRVSISGWTQPLGVTSPSACEGDLMKKSGLTVRMNAESGDALDSGDEVIVNNITIAPKRNYEVPEQESGTNYPGKPFEGDTPAEYMITIELRAKDSTNAAWFTAYQAGTTQKMDITITGDTITGTSTPYTLYLVFPSLRFDTPPAYDFKSPIPVTVSLKMMKAQGNPTGMSARVPYGYIYNALSELAGYPAIS